MRFQSKNYMYTLMYMLDMRDSKERAICIDKMRDSEERTRWSIG